MINKIWFLLVFVGIMFSFISGNNDIGNVILNTSYDTLDMLMSIAPLVVLWSGIMNIASDSGLLYRFSCILKPFLKILMPTVKGDKAFEYISSNIAANMLGLGSVATPAGLKAMKELDEDNKHNNVASEGMITFLVLNTSGLTLIPISIIALRNSYNSINPSSIILPCIVATSISTICGLLMDYLIRRKNVE